MIRRQAIPDIRQSDVYDCGLACLRVLIAFHDRDAGEWLEYLPNPIQGTSPDTIEAALWRHFPNVVRGSMDLDTLAMFTAAGRPVICPITYQGNDGHYVTAYRVSPRRVYYHDPETGFQTATPAKWLTWWRDVETFHVYRNFGLTAWPARGKR